jgi:hypothetical protein
VDQIYDWVGYLLNDDYICRLKCFLFSLSNFFVESIQQSQKPLTFILYRNAFHKLWPLTWHYWG